VSTQHAGHTNTLYFGHARASHPRLLAGIGHFQCVTMRLIAERLLPHAASTMYVDRELIVQKLKPLTQPQQKHDYHLFCSRHLSGAVELITELCAKSGVALKIDSSSRAVPVEELRTRSSRRVASRSRSRSNMPSSQALLVTTDADHVGACDHMLLYLTSLTWTRPTQSAALAEELHKALDLGVHVLLAHESATRTCRTHAAALVVTPRSCESHLAQWWASGKRRALVVTLPPSSRALTASHPPTCSSAASTPR